MRSLARAGVEVYVLGDRWSLPRLSRYCSHFVEVPAGPGVQERWLSWLEHGPRPAIVLSCHDDGLELVARNRQWLVDKGYVPFEAEDEGLLAMLDKQRTYELAAALGVPAPKMWAVSNREELESAAGEAEFPCALKPRHSHLSARKFEAKLLVAQDRDELRAAYERTLAAGVDVILTEFVPGRDGYFSYYTYLDERGEPLFHVTKQKLRQYPNQFGPGSYHVTEWRPEVAELGLRFVQGAGLRGLVVPEFKCDPRDGRLKLMEVNHRFTASDEILRVAGINLALLTYARLAGEPMPELNGYKLGTRLWFPLHDLRAFLEYRGKGQLSLGQWLRSLAHRQHVPGFAWDDPAPSFLNLPVRALRGLERRR
jgi:predicted ATP-grasp superfamily ATP-dependent carboligase